MAISRLASFLAVALLASCGTPGGAEGGAQSDSQRSAARATARADVVDSAGGAQLFGDGSPASEVALERGRRYTGWLLGADCEPIEDLLTPEMRTALGERETLCAIVQRQLGEPARLDSETVVPWLGSSIYVRTGTWSKIDLPINLQWTVRDADGAIEGCHFFQVQDPAPSAHLEHRTSVTLRLPFEEEWFVFWGGRSALENYHVVAKDQRFAYDFAIAQDGRTYAGDGKSNSQYHAYGMPVVAPADGVVVSTANDVPDNLPGRMNPAQPMGNHVIIDHGTGEWSFLAHFQPGTVRVTAGQIVQRGTLLGACGNSGNSSEPHLHYHLQDSAEFGKGAGLPAQFEGYHADGQLVLRGEPRRGQRVEVRGGSGR